MVKNDNERHRYGQHYTPEIVARLLAAFAIRSASDSVLDPSCGDGRLLGAALDAKVALASADQNGSTVYARGAQVMRSPNANLHSNGNHQLFGIDRSRKAVAEASTIEAQVAVADFFEVKPGHRLSESFSLPSQFDAIIGNPPYIRQELLGADKSRIAQVFRLRVQPSGTRGMRPEQRGDDVHIPRWSGRSDIYVYFFAHALGFLRPGGRLVFLTASSWLDVGYGKQLQEFMLRNFRVVLVLESAVESFFEDASVNTSITVLEREPDPERRNNNPVRFIQALKPLADIMPAGILETIELARRAERGIPPLESGVLRIRTVKQGDLQRSDESGRVRRPRIDHSERGAHGAPLGPTTWGRFLRAEDVFFRVIEKGQSRLARLSDLASVRFGVKTGANDFFYLKTESNGEVGRPAGLTPLESLARIRRGMTTGANEFFYLRAAIESEEMIGEFGCLAVRSGGGDVVHIESKYLKPVMFSLKEIPGIEIGNVRTRMLLFDCRDRPQELTGSRAIKYIRAGERAGIHLRPTCSARFPWYGVARGKEPAPLIFPSKVGERWVVAINRAGVYEDKKLYGIFPSPTVPIRLLAALLNSTWARYYAEMTCRQLTGAQAIADIDVAVADQILLPHPVGIDTEQRRRLTGALRALARRPIYSIFDEANRADRRLLDELVLAAIGFNDDSERKQVLTELYSATTTLVRARLARSRGRT
jgi:hypothetical protein